MPSSFSMQDGAACPVVYITAYMMMFDLGNLQEGDTFLIHGAGGGVGTAAIQLAKLRDATVIAQCAREKSEEVLQIGAD